MSTREPSNEERAQRYAAHGWPVFPCTPGAKVPLPGTHGLLEASTDPDRIRSWWRCRPERNVAVATGAPGPDVLDVDHHGERGNGFAAFNRLKREGLVDGASAIVSTPSGGFHAYFAGTDQRSGKIAAEHVDFRGRGGYVLVPPSQVGGRPYAVAQRIGGTGQIDWQACRDVLAPQPQRSMPEHQRKAGRGLDHLPGWVSGLPEGNRNDGMFWAACRAVEAGDEQALAAIGNAGLKAGLSEREVIVTLGSARRRVDPTRQREAG